MVKEGGQTVANKSELLRQQRAERQRLKEQKERERLAKASEARKAAIRRDWLRKERSKPRIEIQALYGESIYVHKRVYDGFMKLVGRKIRLDSMKVTGGSGSSLLINYYSVSGGRGTLELIDLGPMPTG